MFKRLGSLLELDRQAESETKNEVELTEVMITAREQIEYYLSAVNLDKDKFMREKTQESPEGFIHVDVFMNCNRIKQLGISSDELLSCCATSHFLVVDYEKQAIRPKTLYKKDSRRRQKTVRMTGFSASETANSIYELLVEVTAEPQNVLLQYSYDEAGGRVFTGAVNVLYFTEDAADAAVETSLMAGGQKITIEYLSDYEQKLKHEKKQAKKST